MELRVIKKFNGKAEGKTLCPGDIIQSNDVERINVLVGRGFCVIASLGNTPAPTDPNATGEVANDYAEFQGRRYHIDTVKAALGVIGVRVAHNAKEKAVNNALSTLTDEQVQALVEALDNNEATTPNNATE
ncbi:MAG: hypothetical protein HDS50_00175 [Bacteroides sp.]|nr:hypothetical protein [Bacteroides sp.]